MNGERTLQMGMPDMMRRLVLNVTINTERTRLFNFRLWVGLRFVKLGGWICGFGGVNVRQVATELRDTQPSESPSVSSTDRTPKQ